MKSENAQKGITGVFLPGWLSWVLTFCMAFSSLGAALGSTYGIWTVSTAIESNSVSAGVWDSDPEPEEPADPDVPDQIPHAVLNEIYPAPPSGENLEPPLDREWVEIYNDTDSEIDVEGWYISELQGSGVDNKVKHKISSTNTCINLKIGYARPFNEADTRVAPGGLLIIEFCASSRLNQGTEGDTVKLYDGSGNELDAYSYGKTDSGKSHAHLADGSWVLADPSPGLSNQSMESMTATENTKDEKIDSEFVTGGSFVGQGTSSTLNAQSNDDEKIKGEDQNGLKGEENNDSEEKDLITPENTDEVGDTDGAEHPNDPTVITDPEPSTKPESSPEPEDPPVEPEPEPAKTKESAPAAPSEPAPEPPPAPSAPDSSSESAS